MLLNQVLRKDLALIMTNVADADAVVGVEKLVVFVVSRYEHIGPGPNGIQQQKTPHAPANGYTADGPVGRIRFRFIFSFRYLSHACPSSTSGRLPTAPDPTS